MKTKYWSAIGAVMALLLVAAACSSNTDDTNQQGGNSAEAGMESDGAATEDNERTDDVTAGAEDDEAIEDGQATVDEAAADEELGINSDNVLIGPSGFKIDLNECPPDWNDTQGITDDALTLGTSWPFSGALAAFGLIADGMENYFNYVNEAEGGLGGRQMTLVTKDDAYEPARVVANVGELVEQEEVFSIVTLAGTPGNLAVYDSLNEQCVPHMFSSTGHPAWGDPNFHPWTTPSFLAYTTEARIWGTFIEAQVEAGELEAPVDVAALVMNNDFGLAYRNEFEVFANDSDVIGEVTFELHDPAAPNVTNELTTLGGTDADVGVLMTTGVYCTQGFTGVAQADWDPALKLFSNTCAGIESFFVPAGTAGVGWSYAGHAKDTADPAWAEDPFVQLVREQLEGAGLDPDKSQYGNGWFFAWANVEAMNSADALPGGLSRTNLMLATRQMNTKNPGYFEGVDWILDGSVDGYPTEAAAMLEYQIPEGEETGSHVIISDIISAEGQSGLCHFVDGSCINE